jgi:Na+/H+ antiporter NhaC
MQMTTKVREKRDARGWELAVPIVGTLAILYFTSVPFFTKEISLHISAAFGVLFAVLVATLMCGYSWGEVEEDMINGIRKSMDVIIFIAVFSLFISSSIVSGWIPTLIYYITKSPAIAEAYKLNPTVFIPLVVLIIMVIKKYPAVPSIVLGVFLNGIAAKLFQGTSFADILVNTLYGGALDLGSEFLNKVLLRLNGFYESLWLITLVIVSVMLYAVLKKIGFLKGVQ